MDDIEKYIKENKSMFDEKLLPDGDQERFFERFEKDKKRRSKMIFWFTACSAAASVLLILGLFISYNSIYNQTDEIELIYYDYNTQVNALKIEIDQQADKSSIFSSQDEKERLYQSIDNIAYDAIPLTELLPKEMDKNEKITILTEYYTRKIDGIKLLQQEISNK
jgi:hypothetical protein